MEVHRISVESRNKVNVTGVSECISFEPNQVVLDTIEGRLVIKGEELHVTRLALEKGEADIVGKISSLTYTKPAKDKSDTILSRIFA